MKLYNGKLFSNLYKHKNKILLIAFVLSFTCSLIFANKSVDKQIERYDAIQEAEIGVLNDSQFKTVDEYVKISDATGVVDLKNSQTLTQTYTTPTLKLKNLMIYYSSKSESGIVDVTLKEGNKIVFSKAFDLSKNKDVLNLELNEIKYPVRTDLTLTITPNELPENTTFQLLTHNVKRNGYELTGVNDEATDSNIVLTKTSGTSTFFYTKNAVILIGISFFFILALIISWIKNNDKFSSKVDLYADKLKEKHLLFIVEFIMTLSIVLLFLRFIIYYFNYQVFSIGLFILLYLLLLLFILYLIRIFKFCRNDWSKLFLFIAIPVGLFFLVFLLPDSIPDEPVHFFKTVLTSNFDFTNNNVTHLPSNYVERGIHNYNQLWNELFTTSNYHTNLVEVAPVQYSFVLYLVPSLGVMVAKVLSLSIYMGYFLARMMNFIAFLALGYKAIKITPYGKVMFFIFLMNPMMIHQAISVSADVMINSILILFIAYVLKLKFQEKNLQRKDFIILLLFLLFICVSKYAYLPLFGLTFILYDKISQINIKKIILGIMGCLAVFAIYIFINKIVYVSGGVVQQVPDSNIVPKEQLNYLLSSPLNTFNVLIQTLIKYGSFYWFSFFGRYLSWLDLHVNIFAILIYIVLFFISPFLCDEKNKISRKAKIWMAIIFVASMIAIILGLYLTWTQVGKSFVEGVQGRYFIPFAILPLFILSGKKLIKVKRVEVYLILLLAISYAIILANIIFSMGRI